MNPIVNDRENTFELYLHLVPHQIPNSSDGITLELLTRNQAIVHVLKCCEIAKPYVHWQITSKCSLLSLWMDKRISETVKKMIEELISDGTLLNYDYLLNSVV